MTCKVKLRTYAYSFNEKEKYFYVSQSLNELIMKYVYTLVFLFVISTFSNCKPDIKNTSEKELEVEKDSVIFSFTFVGCNRVNRKDTIPSIPSTANKYVLQRILKEVNELEHQPELFFFLGDLVLGESNNKDLDKQLNAWINIYENDSISKSSIELVAVPGNHEMLFAKKVLKKKKRNKKKPKKKDYTWKEFPLLGSTDTWLNHMKDYMPKDRITAPSSDTLDNRMTFSFTRHNVGFVVMNTDSYNSPTKKHPYGVEGMVPTQWIIDKVNEFQEDATIDHIFVLGHKPYYVAGKGETGHDGLPAGPLLWPALQKARVNSMLSAHKHDYQRWQPINDSLGGGTYQVVAGNGGSEGKAPFFGFSTISIMKSGKVNLNSVGFCIGDPYTEAVPHHPTKPRDGVTLTWEENTNVYPWPYNGCE